MASSETATEAPDGRNMATAALVYEGSLRKRTRQDRSEEGNLSSQLEKRSKTEGKKCIFGVELHPETPLPPKWKQLQDVKSGKRQFCNTRTQRTMLEDLKRSPEATRPSMDHMSLNLELKLLPCDPGMKREAKDQSSDDKDNPSSVANTFIDLNRNHQKSNSLGLHLNRSPSWLAFEGENDRQEMVAMVCMRCHMLVMLCKSSPACPNCKYMHTPEQSSPKLFNPSRLSLLC